MFTHINLEVLCLRFPFQIDSKLLFPVLRNNKTLKILSIKERFPSIENELFEEVSKNCKNLKVLIIEGKYGRSKLTDDCIPFLKELKSLEQLEIGEKGDISEEKLASLINDLQNLQVFHCELQTDLCLNAFIAKATNFGNTNYFLNCGIEFKSKIKIIPKNMYLMNNTLLNLIWSTYFDEYNGQFCQWKKIPTAYSLEEFTTFVSDKNFKKHFSFQF
ncbi:hypothetical protein B4U80_14004 [Leptotrombidium deliense]|uniref:Uncharacterized protein n=1 Tax=Leptotrombidium deliense TaxID=299467 RepID=A0A443S5D5_9ACAR|nr:hypothetical protein B4U80_14004 [Leptotrombidium deliense]